jgi:hypothetical protein
MNGDFYPLRDTHGGRDTYVGRNLLITGNLSSVNGLSNAGFGLPFEVAEGDFTGKTAAQTLVSYAPTATGSFLVSEYLNLTTVGGSTSVSVTVTFTDEASNSRTLIPIPAQTVAGFYIAGMIHIRAAITTSVSVQTAGTFTGTTYDAGGAIFQLA